MLHGKVGLEFLHIRKESLLTEEEKELARFMSKEYADWCLGLSNEEYRLIRKYTFNSYDVHKPNRFFERLNRTMRGAYCGTDKVKLMMYGEIISNAICRHSISRQIICYRGVDDDLFENVKTGSVFTFDQFVSTSIAEAGALKKKFKYVIVVPKGANGVYLENVSAFKGQYEFLLDYRCKYRLLSKNGRIIHLEVVL